jgi:hypothetical protein
MKGEAPAESLGFAEGNASAEASPSRSFVGKVSPLITPVSGIQKCSW